MKERTMTGIYFNNPIKILHHFREAVFTERQAEAQVEVLSDYIEHGLVTKKDLKNELKELEFRMTVRTTTIVASIVGFFSLLSKFF